MSNSETKIWNNISKIYEDKFMSMDFYNLSYDKFCSLLPKDAKILEVGCGPGNITVYLQTKRPDFEILATDFATKMVELASKNVPTATFQVLDARKLETLNLRCQGIIAGFIFPFFTQTDVLTFFQNSANMLGEKGVLYFSFVEGKPADSHVKKRDGGDELFFRFHEKTFIDDALRSTGFAQIEEFKIDYPISETKSDVHTVIIAQKKG